MISDMPHYENNLPSNWVICKLEDIAFIGTGATPDTRIGDYYKGNIPWINSSSTKGEYIDTPSSYISEKAIKETNCQLYPSGSLIMAMYGEGKTRGQVSELRFDSTTNQACAAIVPIDNHMKGFIKVYLKSNYYHIRTLAEGGNQPNLNLSKISQYIIPIPPIEEQVRIVAAIKQWFSLIEKLEAAKDDLLSVIQQTKSKILDLAIHGKLVPQDPNDEPAIELLKHINPSFVPCDNAHYENVPFEIPKSWVWTCMAEVNEYNSASVDPSKSPDNDFELYSVPAYETGMPEFVKGKDISSSKKLVSRNDVLLCKINPHLNRAWIVSHYKEDIPCLASSEWIIFRNSAIHPQYLSFCFTSLYFKELMLSNVSGVGGSLMRAQPAIVYKYLFPLPPINEQCRIVATIKNFYGILESISANL